MFWLMSWILGKMMVEEDEDEPSGGGGEAHPTAASVGAAGTQAHATEGVKP